MQRHSLIRLCLMACLGTLLTPFASLPVAAQAWPERTIKVVVPYPPGGNVDGAARIIADRLQSALGQNVVIENKAGAGGLIGSESVAKAEPDGYTLLLGANSPILFAPEMANRRAYEWRRDFAPITMVSLTPIVLQVNAKLPVTSLKELFDYAKKEPDKLTMASPGPGTTNHLLSELLQDRLKLKWVTVHYKGNAPATNDLVAGHVQFNFDQTSVALPFIESGQTRALAVTGNKRVQWLPNVPSFAEAGYPGYDGATFTGLLAPAKTPQAVIQRLNKELTQILNDPEVKQRFAVVGADTIPTTPEAFRDYLEKEDTTWIPVIRRLNIKQQ